MTAFTFIATKRNGELDPSGPRRYGDPDGDPVNLGFVDASTPPHAVEAMLSNVLWSGLSLDDRITLMHVICHSVKYAGLIRSGSI